MHFTIVILAILALASSASAFVVEAFSGPQCTGGSPQRVNIWDNTCGSWMNDYQSVRLVHHGGRGQVAYFCHGYCMDCRFWLAGRDSELVLGQCIDLGGGPYTSMASFIGGM